MSGERNLTRDEAKAAILKDTNDKMIADARESAEKAERLRKEQSEAILAKGGASKEAQGNLTRSLLSSNPDRTVPKATEHLATALERDGMSGRDARLEAERMMGDVTTKIFGAFGEAQFDIARMNQEALTKAPVQRSYMDFAHDLTIGGDYGN